MSVDYSCLFPTGMLNIGLHPQKEMEVELCWAYNRWLTEKVLPESDDRFYSMLCLPFSDPDAALRHVETFGDRKHVGGFMVTTVRSTWRCNDNAYMKVYRAIEERGLVLSFHSGPNWGEPIFKSCNRFISVHALGFTWYNILHCTNWVINGMGERFPKLPVIWIESGLAWVPFLMQRLDHEYMLRPSECPLLKKKPSDYMRDMYYSSQPMEIQDMEALECTFRMINAETQLLYSSDYPHWDFDLPSTIYDLPFLSEKGKHNILGGTAARLFKLPPRNEQQKGKPARSSATSPPDALQLSSRQSKPPPGKPGGGFVCGLWLVGCVKLPPELLRHDLFAALAVVLVGDAEVAAHGGADAVRGMRGHAPAAGPHREGAPVIGIVRHEGRLVDLLDLGRCIRPRSRSARRNRRTRCRPGRGGRRPIRC